MIDKALKETLDQLLNDWHHWSKKTAVVSMPGKCAMFSQAQTPRHWDSTADIDDAAIQQSTMDALDFAILGDIKGHGGLPEPQRTAVCFYAKNLSAKVSVWISPRLPENQIARQTIVNDGLCSVAKKLHTLGVI